jgi:hypothetical protein
MFGWMTTRLESLVLALVVEAAEEKKCVLTTDLSEDGRRIGCISVVDGMYIPLFV